MNYHECYIPSGVISLCGGRSQSTLIITMTTPIPLPAEVTPTSLPLPDPEAYEGEPREYARALMQRKTDIELEIVCP